jgi:hypothetical protein
VQINPTYDAYIFSCIHKVYNEKFRRYVYYYWFAKHVKAPTVEKKWPLVASNVVNNIAT